MNLRKMSGEGRVGLDTDAFGMLRELLPEGTYFLCEIREKMCS